MPADGYEFLEELGGRQGTFISVFMDTEISPLSEDEFTNVAFDRTEEFAALEDYYANEKSDLVTRQLIIASSPWSSAAAHDFGLLLTAVISPLPSRSSPKLRIALWRDLRRPVEVVEESDYVDIQRLLQSGQVLMEKMEEAQSDD